MFTGHDASIRDLLAAGNLISAAELAAAWKRREQERVPFSRILVDSGVITLADLLHAIARQLGLELAANLPEVIGADLDALVPAEARERFGVVPISVDADGVWVAVADPFRPQLAGELQFSLGRPVRLCVADPDAVVRLLDTGDLRTRDRPAGVDSGTTAPVESLDERRIARLAAEAPVVRFVDEVLARAVRDRASDVHFEPFEDRLRVRSRIDGVLRALPSPDRSHALPVTSRLKVLAGLDIAERRLPQDGRMRLVVGGRAVDLRLSTLPTQFGESAVLRILDPASVGLDLQLLGMQAPVLEGVRRAIARTGGLFLVTGPTGSGKTTTLYSCLQALNKTGRKLLTIEDPVEYEIEGVMQVGVNAKAGLTFASALRSFLRNDPDVVMVGEVRDSETARIAVQAALTGHLVLCTLHTSDAPGALSRLVDLGVEPYLLSSTITAVLAQRLIRRICDNCRSAVAEPQRAPGFGWRGAGCSACAQSGYRGRTGIYELLELDESLREQIAAGEPVESIRRAAIAGGMTTLLESAAQAVTSGATTHEEISVLA